MAVNVIVHPRKPWTPNRLAVNWESTATTGLRMHLDRGRGMRSDGPEFAAQDDMQPTVKPPGVAYDKCERRTSALR